MIRIVFDPKRGSTMPDAKIADYVARMLRLGDTPENSIIISVGSKAILEQFQTAIFKGDIDLQNIVFVYNSTILETDQFGEFINLRSDFPKY